jgi:hypothetical protein
MVSLPKLSIVDFLVGRRFPNLRPKTNRFPSPRKHAADRAGPVQCSVDAHQLSEDAENSRNRYRSELLQKSAEELEDIFSRELELVAKERSALAEAEEKQRFYNQPMSPDYEHYGRCAAWTLDEAIALSFGKDPDRVCSKNISPYASHSPFAQDYMKRWKEVQRAKLAGQLWDPVFPSIFIPWASNNGIELPAELISAIKNTGVSLKNWQNLYEEAIENNKAQQAKLRETLEELRTVLSSCRADNEMLRQQLKSIDVATEPSLDDEPNTQTRNSMEKLIIGMAVGAYRYDPRPERSKVTSEIYDDLQRLGVGLDQDTVLKYLKRGAKHVSDENLEAVFPTEIG